MKKFAAIVMALLLCFGLVACATPDTDTPAEGYANVLEKILAEGQIVVGISPDYAPCEFVDPSKTGQESIVGSDVEFAKYIAEQLGVTLVLETMDFDSIQIAVETGKVDVGISGFSYTDERAAAVGLTDKYNMNDYGQGLLVRAGEEGNYTSAESFSGKTVAAQSASLQYSLATAQLPEDCNIELVSNINDAIMMLMNNTVDAVAVSGENGAAIASSNPGVVMCPFQFEIEDEGYVCMVQKGQDELLAKLNEIIAVVVEEDLYNVWLSDAQDLQKQLGIE